MLAAIAAAIERDGSIGFDRYQELALYGPGGFFSAGGGSGRRADFLTSPEIGPLFGAVIGNALDAWWDELDRPDPFVVIEAGAGSGALAVAVLAAAPRCTGALRYVLVERSPQLRRDQQQWLTLTDPALSFAGTGDDGSDDGGDPRPLPAGPIVTSLAELPAGRFTGVVLANELLDNLPVRIAQRRSDGWSEVRITVDVAGARSADPGLAPGVRPGELLVPLDDETTARLERLVPDPPRPGARIPVADEARRWLRDAADIVEQGRVVVIDYGAPTAVLAERGGWLRTYRTHERGTDPYLEPGAFDITSDVPFDQLDVLGPPDLDGDQAAFLRDHGLEDLVAQGRRIWAQRAGTGDLAAVRARSRVREAEALTDPDGLGAFRVLSWRLGRSGRRRPPTDRT